jgi:hypothetical protein
MGMKHEQAARICSIDTGMPKGHAKWTSSRNAASKDSTDMQQGRAT